MIAKTSLKEYFRKHPVELFLVLIGTTYAITTLYCDFIALHDHPPLVIYRVLFAHEKPEGMSILPPISYYRNPPGGLALVPLSLADLFSLYFPIAYLIFVHVEAFRYHRWKDRQIEQNVFF
jgi:hypothetical protein